MFFIGISVAYLGVEFGGIMKKLILSILALFIATPTLASSIECHTPQNLKGFVIQSDTIILNEKNAQFSIKARDRYISSVSNNEEVSVNKVFEFEGKNYKLFIKNKNQFSELEDFVSIRSVNGHMITYPLSCH